MSLFATQFVDTNNPTFVADPASTSVFNYFDFGRIRPRGVGSDSGIGQQNYAIYQESGAWTHPYPDMRIAYTTGIKLGANASYDGIRFYDDYTLSGRVMQWNGSTNYIYADKWMSVTGTQGFYSPSYNNAYLYPNDASYGSWRMTGTRNGWYGIEFESAMNLMMNDTEAGFHRNGDGWYLYCYLRSQYVVGDVVAYYSDRRLKQNIRRLNQGEGFELINKLKPSEFEWNSIALKGNETLIPGRKEISLIAQEVEEILPIAVVENKAGRSAAEPEVESYLTIKYNKITPYLIQAVKDLNSEIEYLIKEINILETELESIE